MASLVPTLQSGLGQQFGAMGGHRKINTLRHYRIKWPQSESNGDELSDATNWTSR